MRLLALAVVLAALLAHSSAVIGQDADVPMSVATRSLAIRLPLARSADGQITPLSNDQIAAARTGALWLHARGKSTCYFVKDVHEYETFVTVAEDENSPRVPVDELTLNFQIGPDHGSQTCAATEWCAKTIEEYNLRCRVPRCVSGRAKYHGLAWGAGEACW